MLFFVLMVALIAPVQGQESRKVKHAKRKAEKVKEKQIKEGKKEEEAKKKRHYHIQSKEVQARMDESSKQTKSYYDKKSFKHKMNDIFTKKPRKKRHGK